MIRLSGGKLLPISGSVIQFQSNSSSALVRFDRWGVLEKDKDQRMVGHSCGNRGCKITNLDELDPLLSAFWTPFIPSKI